MPRLRRRAMERGSEVDDACVALKARDVANLHFKRWGFFDADPVTERFLQCCCWLCHPSVAAVRVRCPPAWRGAPPALRPAGRHFPSPISVSPKCLSSCSRPYPFPCISSMPAPLLRHRWFEDADSGSKPGCHLPAPVLSPPFSNANM